MKIKGYTIIYATKDNDEAMGKFYTEVLGCTKDETTGMYNLNGMLVGFDRHSKAAEKALEPFRCMITLEVEDINNSVEELESKGVKFIRMPGQEFWGGWFATFEDPDGNYLQLFQHGEPPKK
ncbi:MAG: Glyoxalase/bleomycin resistance protein/dioxygenase [uncultured bacterium]|nr:MAG: Glyoxalase/bleomycin resistance protein/dioxygenase [uncultured bacterium]